MCNYSTIAGALKADPKTWREIVKQEEVLVVRLDGACEGKFLDAYLLRPARRSLKEALWDVTPHDYPSESLSTEVAISLADDEAPVLTFYETRPNSKDHKANGINARDGERYFPYVIYLNAGTSRLTVNGEWMEPGEPMVVHDVDINRPDVKEALERFCSSPEVTKAVMEAQKEYARKKQERKDTEEL